MLWFDQEQRLLKMARSALLAFPLVLSACQIHPLYSDSGISEVSTQTIGFAPARNRIEQTVRNRLIFLLNGGAGEAPSPRYTVNIAVGGSATTYLLSTATAETYPGRLVMEGSYSVTESLSQQIIYKSRQSLVALRDFTRQEFANIRTTRDAEDRAANEMAERIRAEIVTHLDSQGQWRK